MKTLLRLSAAAALAVTACGEVPTAAKIDVAPARMQGGWTAGGGYLSDGDTTTITTINSDQTTTGPKCVEERGGWTMGGGYLVDQPCE